MNDPVTNPDHHHTHGPGCHHTSITHATHIDYIHDGHLHHMEGEHVEDHVIGVDKANPAGCTPNHACGVHDAGHKHAEGCGHQAVPHGDHMDYLVGSHLHHPHGSHCDDHGSVQTG